MPLLSQYSLSTNPRIALSPHPLTNYVCVPTPLLQKKDLKEGARLLDQQYTVLIHSLITLSPPSNQLCICTDNTVEKRPQGRGTSARNTLVSGGETHLVCVSDGAVAAAVSASHGGIQGTPPLPSFLSFPFPSSSSFHQLILLLLLLLLVLLLLTLSYGATVHGYPRSSNSLQLRATSRGWPLRPWRTYQPWQPDNVANATNSQKSSSDGGRRERSNGRSWRACDSRR